MPLVRGAAESWALDEPELFQAQCCQAPVDSRKEFDGQCQRAAIALQSRGKVPGSFKASESHGVPAMEQSSFRLILLAAGKAGSTPTGRPLAGGRL